MAKLTQKAYQNGSECPTLEPGKIYLYGMRFCPYVNRVKFVLSALNIEYEDININLRNKPDWFLKKSKEIGKVPIVEKDGKIISESLVITEYLNDTYSDSENQLYHPPGNERDHEKELINDVEGLSLQCLYYLQGLINKDGFWDPIIVLLDRYEEELKRKNTKFFGGDKPMIVDYILWPSIDCILAILIAKPELGSFPKSKYIEIAKWIDNMAMDSVVKKTGLDRKLYAAFLQTFDGDIDYDIGL